MKLGIVGYGAVGKATAFGFRSKGHAVYINDLKQFDNEIIHTKKFLLNECDLIFICVPTPSNPDGRLDTSLVEDVVVKLAEVKSSIDKNPVLVIRSTVVPGTTLRLMERYPSLKFAFNPEFLRVKYANDDFLRPDRIVIGASSEEINKKVAKAYEHWTCPIILTDSTTAETIKLASNCFLAYKVAYACEVSNFCKVLNVDPVAVMNAVCLDARIGKTHLDPSNGPIPKSSHCLPKDLSGLICHLESKGYVSKLLKVAYDVGVEKQ